MVSLGRFRVLLLLLLVTPCHGLPRSEPSAPYPTLHVNYELRRNATLLEKRSITTELSTCGYSNGNPDRPRTANSGFNCRVDTRNGLWGFCPSTVISATDCGLAGSCYDKHDCSEGCGQTERRDLTTFTCRDDFCSIALLTFGVDQTYSYIACGANSRTEHFHIRPTAEALTTTTTSSESPSSSPTSSTSSDSINESTPSSTAETSVPTGPPVEEPSSTLADTSSGSEAEVPSPSGDSTETQPASAESSTEDSGAPIGAIIGGVLGGIALLCATVIAVVFLLRRRNNREAKPERSPVRQYQPPQDWAQPKHLSGGWGPRELPSGQHHHVQRSPVELAG